MAWLQKGTQNSEDGVFRKRDTSAGEAVNGVQIANLDFSILEMFASLLRLVSTKFFFQEKFLHRLFVALEF